MVKSIIANLVLHPVGEFFQVDCSWLKYNFLFFVIKLLGDYRILLKILNFAGKSLLKMLINWLLLIVHVTGFEKKKKKIVRNNITKELVKCVYDIVFLHTWISKTFHSHDSIVNKIKDLFNSSKSTTTQFLNWRVQFKDWQIRIAPKIVHKKNIYLKRTFSSEWGRNKWIFLKCLNCEFQSHKG